MVGDDVGAIDRVVAMDGATDARMDGTNDGASVINVGDTVARVGEIVPWIGWVVVVAFVVGDDVGPGVRGCEVAAVDGGGVAVLVGNLVGNEVGGEVSGTVGGTVGGEVGGGTGAAVGGSVGGSVGGAIGGGSGCVGSEVATGATTGAFVAGIADGDPPTGDLLSHPHASKIKPGRELHASSLTRPFSPASSKALQGTSGCPG